MPYRFLRRKKNKNYLGDSLTRLLFPATSLLTFEILYLEPAKNNCASPPPSISVTKERDTTSILTNLKISATRWPHRDRNELLVPICRLLFVLILFCPLTAYS